MQYLRADKKYSRSIAVIASLLGLIERTSVFGSIQAPQLRIRSAGGPILSAHDGEVADPADELDLRILPRRLTVYTT